MADQPESSSEEGDAAQAFEALRLEVLVLRRSVEQLPKAWQGSLPPDYTLSLGEITKGLAQVSGRLAQIEQHPALKMTPANHQQAILQGGSAVFAEAVRRLEQARQGSEHTQAQLAAMIGVVRARDQQRRWLMAVGIAALIVGIVVTPFLSRWLPFGVNGRVAATVMGTDRWHAGAALMEAQSPEGWHNLEAAASLWQANQGALTACREAAAKIQKEQRCTILVPAP